MAPGLGQVCPKYNVLLNSKEAVKDCFSPVKRAYLKQPKEAPAGQRWNHFMLKEIKTAINWKIPNVFKSMIK